MIKIIALGKIKEKYLQELINDYLKRINKYHKLEIIELKDSNNLKSEAEDILKHINEKDYVICLDIKGKEISSNELAETINQTFIHYSNLDFVIGSSEGLDEKVKIKAHQLISFSKLTFPHGLFRGLLLEQIYRSFKILNNEKYHK